MKKALALVTVALICSTSFAAWQDSYKKRYDGYIKSYDRAKENLEKGLPKQKLEDVKQIYTKRLEVVKSVLAGLENYKKAIDANDKKLADKNWQILVLKIQQYNLLSFDNSLFYWKRSYTGQAKKNAALEPVVGSLKGVREAYANAAEKLEKAAADLEKTLPAPAAK